MFIFYGVLEGPETLNSLDNNEFWKNGAKFKVWSVYIEASLTRMPNRNASARPNEVKPS